MPAAFRSISNTSYTSRTNTTVTAPTGIQDGDLLLFQLFTGGASPGITATPPAGFAVPNGGTFPMVGEDASTFTGTEYCWWKIAASESGDYTATHAVCNSQGVMIAVSGWNGVSPKARTNFQTNPGGVADTLALSLTTVANDALVIIMGSDWGDSVGALTPPAGSTPTFVGRLDVVLSQVFTGLMTTAGATGNKSYAQNSVTTNPWFVTMLVAEPPSTAIPCDDDGASFQIVQAR